MFGLKEIFVGCLGIGVDVFVGKHGVDTRTCLCGGVDVVRGVLYARSRLCGGVDVAGTSGCGVFGCLFGLAFATEAHG